MKHLITVAISLAFGNAAFAGTLTLRVEATSASGTLRAALFDSQQAFDANQSVAAVIGQAMQGATVLRFENLEPGTYGIAVFHDQNGNEELDRNLFGAPSEPFGFSNDPKIGFSAPEFDAFQFQFDGTPSEIDITLNGS